MKTVSHRSAKRIQRNYYVLCALCALQWLFIHIKSALISAHDPEVTRPDQVWVPETHYEVGNL
jgi:hypothetical protein